MPATPRLLCIGDLGLDLVISVPRLPGRDQKIAGREVARGAGGMAANVAVGAQRLGTPARLVATVGNDPDGREAIRHLETEGVDVGHVKTKVGEATFYCVILLDQSGEKALVRAAGGTFLPDPSDLDAAVFADVTHVHFIHPDPAVFRRGRDLARAIGASISLDLEAADMPSDPGALAALISELDVLFLSMGSRAAPESVAGPVRPQEGQIVVTTLGASGATVETAGGVARVDGRRVDVVDTLGAGDAFAAAFLHVWLGGAPHDEALAFANSAAALSTRGYGAQSALARPAEIAAALDSPRVRHA